MAAAACSASLFAGILAPLVMPSHACADDMKMETSDKNIVQTATGPGMEDVTTLVKAIKAAGLVDTLEGTGPFTVFAPTNEAFAKLPADKLADLMKPENKEKLAKILTYHVVSGNMDAKELMGKTELKSVEGGELHLKSEDGKLMVNDATVTKPDIKCSNGTIHWVDTVLMPS